MVFLASLDSCYMSGANCLQRQAGEAPRQPSLGKAILTLSRIQILSFKIQTTDLPPPSNSSSSFILQAQLPEFLVSFLTGHTD